MITQLITDRRRRSSWAGHHAREHHRSRTRLTSQRATSSDRLAGSCESCRPSSRRRRGAGVVSRCSRSECKPSLSPKQCQDRNGISRPRMCRRVRATRRCTAPTGVRSGNRKPSGWIGFRAIPDRTSCIGQPCAAAHPGTGGGTRGESIPGQKDGTPVFWPCGSLAIARLPHARSILSTFARASRRTTDRHGRVRPCHSSAHTSTGASGLMVYPSNFFCACVLFASRADFCRVCLSPAAVDQAADSVEVGRR